MIAIMGPTGTGKSGFAEALADALKAQLINADAFQVYREFDIGTNKPADRSRYAMLDLVDGDQQYGVGEWIAGVLPILEKLFVEQRDAVFVGGTGFYIRALFEQFSELAPPPDAELRVQLAHEPIDVLVDRLRSQAPEVAARIDLKNPVRVRRALEKLNQTPIRFELPAFKKCKFKIDLAQAELDPILASRLEQMLEQGWIDEVRVLMDRYNPENSPGFRAIGYATWVRLLRGEVSLEEGKAEVLAATRAYAKRQRTWLRKEPGIVDVNRNAGTAKQLSGVVEDVLRLISANGGT